MARQLNGSDTALPLTRLSGHRTQGISVLALATINEPHDVN